MHLESDARVNSHCNSNQRLSGNHEEDFLRLVKLAQGGCQHALGQLAEFCRPYLLLVANQDLDPRLRGKVGASDVVQETLIAVQNDIAQFRGHEKDDFLAWVRGILINDLLETRRKHCDTAKRDVGREIRLNDDSGIGRPAMEVAAEGMSPSSEAIAKEEAAALAWAMNHLPDHYRQVIQLRNWEEMPFEQIGQRMGRSAESTRKLWSRAVLRLQQALERGTLQPPIRDDETEQ